MAYELFPHQIEDSSRMATEGHLPNWSLPGTGKTLTALEAFRKAGHRYGLVLCPPIAQVMWRDTIRDYLGLEAQIVTSGTASLPTAGIAIATFGVGGGRLRTGLADWADSMPSHTTGALIIDEAHYLKNPDSKRTNAVFGLRADGRGGLFSCFNQCWQLTGTPVSRWSDDLWPQLRCTHPNVLLKYNVLNLRDFRDTFCWTEVKKYHPRMAPRRIVVGSKNQELLRELINDINPPRRKLDIMPSLTKRTLTITGDATLKRLAKEARAVAPNSLGSALANNDPSVVKLWHDLALAKVEPAMEYITEAANVSPVLLGCMFRDVINSLFLRLSKTGLQCAVVTGATPDKERQKIRDRFNAGELNCLIGQMDAMQVSWNLQGGSHVIIMCDHFSPSTIEQFYSRVYRTGQTKNCTVDFIKAEHPIDEALAAVRARKSENMERTID